MENLYHIGVVAHTSRLAQAEHLADQVGATILSVDDGLLGCDDNHEQVQSLLATKPATWSVILEDDALPVEGFNDQLAQALTLSPSPIVSLYLGRLRPPQYQSAIEAATEAATLDNADWIISTHLFHAVGYAIRTELLPSLLNHLTPLPVDQHITTWAQQYGHTIAYTWPSLIDHHDGPTVITQHPDQEPRTPGRTAWNTAAHPTWSTRSVTVRTAP